MFKNSPAYSLWIASWVLKAECVKTQSCVIVLQHYLIILQAWALTSHFTLQSFQLQSFVRHCFSILLNAFMSKNHSSVVSCSDRASANALQPTTRAKFLVTRYVSIDRAYEASDVINLLAVTFFTEKTCKNRYINFA